MLSKRLPSLPQYRATQNHSFSEAREHQCTRLVLHQLNLARTIFPRIPFLCASSLGLSTKDTVGHLEGRREAIAFMLCGSGHGSRHCFHMQHLVTHLLASPAGVGPQLLQFLPALLLQRLWALGKAYVQVCGTGYQLYVYRQGWKRQEKNRGPIPTCLRVPVWPPTSHPAFPLDFWLC